MHRVLLVMRHGKTPLDQTKRSDGWLDLPLSDEGRIQAVEAQQQLKHVELKSVHSSNLKRTVETAEVMGQASELKPKTSQALRPWNLGKLVGEKKAVAKPVVKYHMEHPETKPPDGESVKEFRARFRPAMKKLLDAARAGKGPILVVLSGSNMREIGEWLFNDRNLTDLDETGIVAIYPYPKSGYGMQIIRGKKGDGSVEVS